MEAGGGSYSRQGATEVLTDDLIIWYWLTKGLAKLGYPWQGGQDPGSDTK